MKESKFQKSIIDKLKLKLPGCVILKNDASYIQGIPDLLILYGQRWAALEVKKNKKANVQPNQKYWVDRMDMMSCASFISPENEEEVLYEVCRTLTN